MWRDNLSSRTEQQSKHNIPKAMKITVNDKEVELSGSTVSDLVKQLGVPSNGVAVAVGMDIVPREEWESRALTEGCKVMIIRAASGG